MTVLDLEIIQETLDDGGTDFLEEMIDMFNEEYAEQTESLKQAAEQADSGNIAGIAHKFKGECASLGLTALSEKYDEIEIKGKNNDLSGIESLVGQLEEIYEQTISEVKGFYEAPVADI
ncbi:MAG TPA: hypothetical protein ENK58_04200 [Desulfobacterales bacterium]|nr:hypothetical protein [Desulfobacterales bacterium]